MYTGCFFWDSVNSNSGGVICSAVGEWRSSAIPSNMPKFIASEAAILPSTLLKAENSESTVVDLLTRLTHASFYALMAVWHVCESTIPPPSGKPDFWTVINVLIGVTGFSLCYMWCLFHLYDFVTGQFGSLLCPLSAYIHFYA